MIYFNGQLINAAAAFAIIENEAENNGYDTEDAASMLQQSLEGAEDFNEQLTCDFGIEVVA